MQENNKNFFSINKRIIQFIEYLNISRYKFAKATGVSEVNLLNIYKGKNKPSIDIIEKILNYYKVLNPTWLLTGEGPMLREEIKQDEAYKPPPMATPKKTEPTNDNTCPLCAEKERIIAEKERVIEKQEQIIKDKDKMIALLEAQLANYKAKEGAKRVGNNVTISDELEKEKAKG